MSFTLTSVHGNNGGGSGSFSIGTAATKNDLMIVCLRSFSGGTLNSASDTVGTSYTIRQITSGGISEAICYGFLGGTGANSMTATWSTGNSNNCDYAEFTGSSVSGCVQDGSMTSSMQQTAATVTTPTITTTGSDDLVINYVFSNASISGFTGWTSAVNGGFGGAIGYQADVSAGTYTPNCNPGASPTWDSLCIAFKAVSTTPQGPPLVVGQAMKRASYF